MLFSRIPEILFCLFVFEDEQGEGQRVSQKQAPHCAGPWDDELS